MNKATPAPHQVRKVTGVSLSPATIREADAHAARLGFSRSELFDRVMAAFLRGDTQTLQWLAPRQQEGENK